MSTPEEIAKSIDENFPEETRLASKVSAVITRVLEPLGLSEDMLFRSKVARELIKIRVERLRMEKVS